MEDISFVTADLLNLLTKLKKQVDTPPPTVEQIQLALDNPAPTDIDLPFFDTFNDPVFDLIDNISKYPPDIQKEEISLVLSKLIACKVLVLSKDRSIEIQGNLIQSANAPTIERLEKIESELEKHLSYLQTPNRMILKGDVINFHDSLKKSKFIDCTSNEFTACFSKNSTSQIKWCSNLLDLKQLTLGLASRGLLPNNGLYQIIVQHFKSRNGKFINPNTLKTGKTANNPSIASALSNLGKIPR